MPATPYRTSVEAVKKRLADNYGKLADGVTWPDLEPFLRSANLITTEVAACAVRKGNPQGTAVLREIEEWLAGWLFTKSRPMTSSRSTEGASGSFQTDPQIPEWYKAGALALDFTGCLSAILDKKRASMVWLGKPRSEQIPYSDRE